MDAIVSPYFSSAVTDPMGMDNINDALMDKEKEKSVQLKGITEKKFLEEDLTQVHQQSCSPNSTYSRQKLNENFYEQECTALAKALLGQVIVRMVNGVSVSGTIVETECYLGGSDAASHSYNGKRTPRNEPMYMKAGTLYVYTIYGMYHCLNISSQGEGSCVLIRSLEPIDGIDKMIIGRSQRRTTKSKPLKTHELCNGPSKLCQALYITKDVCNKLDLSVSDMIWLERGQYVPQNEIVTTKRIGIESAGKEWANKPLRYYIFNNKHVSVKDKKTEAKLFS